MLIVEMFARSSRPTIAILGAGAVGGYYGARLAQAGNNVQFLLRSDYEHVRAHGLVVQSIAGDFTLAPHQLRVHNRVADMPKADLVVVTLKSTDNAALLELIPPLLLEHTTLLTLQNGLGNEEFLAEHFPSHDIVGGIAFTCINRIAPGVIHHSDHGHIHVGAFRVRQAQDFDPASIRDLFTSSKIPTQVVPNLLEARWTKLTWNIPFNGLGALLDLSTDRLLASEEGVELIRDLVAETVAVAGAEGFAVSLDIADRQLALTRSMGAYITSTQADRRAGRRLELDSIFIRPLEIAQRHRVGTPNLRFLVRGLEAVSIAAANKRP